MIFKPSLMALISLAFPAPALAQTDDTGPLTLSASCLGEHRSLPLQPIEGGFLDLNGEVSSFSFGDTLTLCIEPDAVVITEDGTDTTLPCADIRDDPNEGQGYAFTSGNQAYGLWFFIAPERRPSVLEIGLSRDGNELLWIDTHTPICGS